MKSLKSILEASVLADIDDQLEAGDETLVRQFIEEYFIGKFSISKRKNKDGKYLVSSKNDIRVKPSKKSTLTSLTNGLFEWSNISGTFACGFCINLKSLKGAPKKVKENFICSYCVNLESLEGAPEKVGGSFDCGFCKKLKSLEGAPKETNGMFYCNDCISLISLKGAPQKVKCFDCTECKNLDSLKYAPKEITSDIFCKGCKVKFTEDDVKKVSNVGHNIYCYIMLSSS